MSEIPRQNGFSTHHLIHLTDRMIIDNLEKENEQLQSQLQEKEKIIIIMEKYFELICDLGFDYDGCNKVESLKNLIDELVHYSNLGRVANTTEEIYMNKDKSFNILHEEIVHKEV